MFDPNKPVQTRDGRPARIICTNRKGDFPIIALIDNQKRELLHSFDKRGNWHKYGPSPKDLINIPEVTYKYQNIYLGAKTTAWRPKRALRVPGWVCIGFLKTTFEDGVYKSCEFIPE